MTSVEHAAEIIQDSFGLWISGLFSAVRGYNPWMTFAQQKKAFFSLIEYMLVMGKIKFIAPGADCYISPNNPFPRFTIHDSEAHWKASPKEIVEYLIAHWPEDALDENDVNILLYFYEMPGVIWVREDGSFVGS